MLTTILTILGTITKVIACVAAAGSALLIAFMLIVFCLDKLGIIDIGYDEEDDEDDDF